MAAAVEVACVIVERRVAALHPDVPRRRCLVGERQGPATAGAERHALLVLLRLRRLPPHLAEAVGELDGLRSGIGRIGIAEAAGAKAEAHRIADAAAETHGAAEQITGAGDVHRAAGHRRRQRPGLARRAVEQARRARIVEQDAVDARRKEAFHEPLRSVGRRRSGAARRRHDHPIRTRDAEERRVPIQCTFGGVRDGELSCLWGTAHRAELQHDVAERILQLHPRRRQAICSDRDPVTDLEIGDPHQQLRRCRRRLKRIRGAIDSAASTRQRGMGGARECEGS